MKNEVKKTGLLKRLLSYVVPVIIKSYESDFSKVLEIRLINNRLVLDSQKANYSFGTLHKVMEAGLLRVLKRGKKPEYILMLGYGGGSLPQIMSQKANYPFRVKAVEIDPRVIEIAKEWFPYGATEFIMADAARFTEDCHERFDLIVSDVFIDLEMPEFATGKEYLNRLKHLTADGGAVIINTIYKQKTAVMQFHRVLTTIFREVEHLPLFEDNHLFIAIP